MTWAHDPKTQVWAPGQRVFSRVVSGPLDSLLPGTAVIEGELLVPLTFPRKPWVGDIRWETRVERLVHRQMVSTEALQTSEIRDSIEQDVRSSLALELLKGVSIPINIHQMDQMGL